MGVSTLCISTAPFPLLLTRRLVKSLQRSQSFATAASATIIGHFEIAEQAVQSRRPLRHACIDASTHREHGLDGLDVPVDDSFVDQRAAVITDNCIEVGLGVMQRPDEVQSAFVPMILLSTTRQHAGPARQDGRRRSGQRRARHACTTRTCYNIQIVMMSRDTDVHDWRGSSHRRTPSRSAG